MSDEEDNVVALDAYTTLDLPIEKVLDGAKEGVVGEVVVIGEGVEGMLYFATSSGNGPKILWLLEQARLTLMDAT